MMNEWLDLEQAFKVVVVGYTVANLAAVGLELNVREAVKACRNPRFVLQILAWGWVAGPALAWLITRVIPLADGHAAGLLLLSLAPTAPYVPLMVRRACGDMSFAAAVMVIAMLGTVVLLPLMGPLLLTGLTVSTWVLAKPMLVLVLLPLAIGVALKVYAEPLADKLFPVVKKIGGIFLLLGVVFILVLYGRDMLEAIGSFAPGAQVLFYVVITLLSYTVGFGLKPEQKSGLALAMCTRNIAPAFAAYLGITNAPAGILVMLVMATPLKIIVALVAARLFARQAPTN
jgi:BASS family bile acid:Na+ symporter